MRPHDLERRIFRRKSGPRYDEPFDLIDCVVAYRFRVPHLWPFKPITGLCMEELQPNAITIDILYQITMTISCLYE